MKNKFKMCYCEHNSFVKIKYEGVLVLRTYVDDIIYMGNSREMRDVFKRSMMKEFAMTDLGRMKYFIEVKIIKDEYSIFINQRKYA